jgi:prepilin-type N-terminal cleavage/methylation domain-containing protein
MLKYSKKRPNHTMTGKQPNKQQGVTLIELMVALAISLVVSTALVMLMANVMGTGTQTIQMTRMTQEMRTAMQLMTRDLRRANYHVGALDCYGNIDCNLYPLKIKVITPEGGDCFRFWYDRQTTAGPDAGAFQLFTRSGVSVVQMTTADNASVSCGNDWGVANDITDPSFMNVTAFTVSNADSYNEVISEDSDTQTISKIRLTLTAALLNTPTGVPVSKTIEDLIMVRNPVFCPAGTCP